MPRIIIDMPSAFAFETDITLGEEHINLSKHLDNAKLLSLISEARAVFWQSLGYAPHDPKGLGNIVADVAVEYKAQAFEGEIMQIAFACQDFHQYGFDLVWQVKDKNSQRQIARGKHGILFFSYQAQKVSPIPSELRQQLSNLTPV